MGAEAEEIAERVLGGGTFSVKKFVGSFPVLVEAAGGTQKLRELAIEFATKGLLLGSTNKATWKTVALADVVVDFQNGISKRRGDSGTPVTVLRLADIDAGVRIRSENFREIALTKDEQEKYRVHAGDVLVIRVNGSGDLVGRFVPCEVDRNWAYSDHLIRMRLRSDLVDARFLCAVSRSASARVHVDSKTVSTAGQKTINQTGLGSLPLSLPPLAEQKRIVARVDQLMALIDQLEAKQNQKRDLGARFTKASLESLTTAESPQALTTAWTRIESNWPTLLDSADKVGEVRKAIVRVALRGRLIQGMITHADSTHFDGIPAVPPWEIPAHWVCRTAEDICEFITKGTTPSPTAMTAEKGDVPFLKVYNLTFGGPVDFTIKPTFVSFTTHEDVLTRSRVLPGDVLMNIVGPPLGKVSIVSNAFPEWNINQAIARFRVRPGLAPQFLAMCLLDVAYLMTSVAADYRGTAGQDNISLAQCRSLPIPLPPLSEQKRIVAKVEHLMKLCDALEAALRRSEDRAAKLAEAVVQEMVA